MSFVLMLVLQWWFCNKLGFGDFGGFSKLRDQEGCFWHFNFKRNVINF
jgi:hypothetical protein